MINESELVRVKRKNTDNFFLKQEKKKRGKKTFP